MDDPPLVSAGDPASTWWMRHQRKLTPLILLAPGAALFSLFVLYPIFENIRLSLYAWNGVRPKVWVGLDNYRELFSDPVFHVAIRNNVIWLLGFLLAAPALGLLLALLLNQEIRAIRFFRAMFFLPFVISQAVVGLIFAWFLNSQFGLLQQLTAWIGAGPVAPLESERWAILAIVCAGLWPQAAYCMMLYLSGLVGLDGASIEAARLLGARGWSLLWNVVLPQLRPLTFVVALVCVVSALRGFDLVMIITQGGPFNSSTVLSYYMYEQTFLNSRYGYAAAISTVLFAMTDVCIGFFLWRFLRQERA